VSDSSGGASKLSACARCSLVVYCSKDCQKAHWKATNKDFCVAKTDQAQRQQGPPEAPTNVSPKAAAAAAALQHWLFGSQSHVQAQKLARKWSHASAIGWATLLLAGSPERLLCCQLLCGWNSSFEQ